jgi:hypothetical protein
MTAELPIPRVVDAGYRSTLALSASTEDISEAPAGQSA